jgi:archaellum component FlaC
MHVADGYLPDGEVDPQSICEGKVTLNMDTWELLKRINERFDCVDKSLDLIDKSLDSIKKRVEEVEARCMSIEADIEDIKSTLRTIELNTEDE